MRNILKTGLPALFALAIFSSCAKNIDGGVNDLTKKYFDAWMAVHHPDLTPTEAGYYILEDTEGDGELIGDEENGPYIYGTYSQRTLDGTYSYCDDSRTAKQLGAFDTSYYYGNHVWDRTNSILPFALDDALSTMRVGGTRTIIVPSWLLTYSRYDTIEEYLNYSSDFDHSIYTLHVDRIIEDEVQWEIDSIETWLGKHYPGTDSTEFGYYYIQTQAPTDTTGFEDDDEVYLDYIGRLLNGQVFDCTIQDTAKRYNLYSSSTTYEPTYVTWDTTSYSALTMGSNSSSVISGFAQAIFNMRTGEKGVVVFYSGLGYSSSVSGNRIPEYSPLIFELAMIGKEDDDDD